MSVDTRLARLWLRLSDTGERCDLLGMRSENGTLVVEAIEVKTVGTGGDAVAPADIEKATRQLASTLAAIESGLEEQNEDSPPLAAPRQEMLKEVFVSGCQALRAGPGGIASAGSSGCASCFARSRAPATPGCAVRSAPSS